MAILSNDRNQSELQRVRQAMDPAHLSAEEMQARDQELDRAQHAYALENRRLDLEAEKLNNVDRSSARGMNVAIQQSIHSSYLAKNFIYIFAILTFVSVAAFDIALVFNIDTIQAADSGKELLSLIAGALHTGVLTVIIAFFYGSSSGSSQKTDHSQEIIRMLMDQRSNKDKVE